MVTTAAGNPVLLKQVLADGSNSSAPVDARSTAEALVLYDPTFLRLPSSTQRTARNNLASHAKLPELVSAIENAVKTDPNDPLNLNNHRNIYELAVLISKDLIAKSPQPKTVEKMDAGNYVGIGDDEYQNQPTVSLLNNSFAYFDVTIKKSGTVVNTPLGSTTWRVGRRNLLTYGFEWPPVKISEAVTAEASLGDGDFSFDFTKQSGISVFDGLMSLASTIIGVKADSMETLDAGYKVLISTGSKVASLVNKMVTQKPNTKEEAEAMFYDIMKSDTGLSDLLDFGRTYFAEKIKKELKESWVKTIAKIAASKLIVWGTGAYGGAEVVAIMLSVSKAPDTYSESGSQSKGRYPGVAISKLDPSQGPVGTSVTITGSGFGTTSGRVRFNGTEATISSWSDKQISVTVPSGATTGSVAVYADSVQSNFMPFTVGATSTGTTLDGNFDISFKLSGETSGCDYDMNRRGSVDLGGTVAVSGGNFSFVKDYPSVYWDSWNLQVSGTYLLDSSSANSRGAILKISSAKWTGMIYPENSGNTGHGPMYNVTGAFSGTVTFELDSLQQQYRVLTSNLTGTFKMDETQYNATNYGRKTPLTCNVPAKISSVYFSKKYK